jgi:hypothetical protein
MFEYESVRAKSSQIRTPIIPDSEMARTERIVGAEMTTSEAWKALLGLQTSAGCSAASAMPWWFPIYVVGVFIFFGVDWVEYFL